MPLEKPSYRDNLERVLEAFPSPHGEMLTVQEVARFLGKDPRTIKRIFPNIKPFGISKASLARFMAKD